MNFQVDEVYLLGGIKGVVHGEIGCDLVPVVTTTEFWDEFADVSVLLDDDQLANVFEIVREVFEASDEIEWMVANRNFACFSADAVSERNLVA